MGFYHSLHFYCILYVSLHSTLDYEACCENIAPTLRHGMGKGLMTYMGASAKKNGRGKGMITQKGAAVKKHGIGKGLMTVWQMTNPDARNLSPDGISSESLVQQKTKKGQTVLVS